MKLVHYTVFDEDDMGLSGITVPIENILYVDGKECLRVNGYGAQVSGARKMLDFLGAEHEYEHRDVYTDRDGPWAPDGMTPQLVADTVDESELGLSDPD